MTDASPAAGATNTAIAAANPQNPAPVDGAAPAAGKPSATDVKPLIGDQPAQTDANTKPDAPADGPGDQQQPDQKPVEYTDFRLPDGFELKGDLMGKFKELAGADKLPQESAQKLVDLYTDGVKQMVQQQYEAWNQTQTQWQQQVKADPDIGGAKFEPTLQAINRVIDQYGDADTKAALKITGAGNNPAIIKMLAKVANVLTEGGFVAGRPGSNRPAGAQGLYTKSTMNP